MQHALVRGIKPLYIFFVDSPERTASYSLYVVGSNGVLTEHVLQPQKLSSAADGDDAPIELARLPRTAWRLMG